MTHLKITKATDFTISFEFEDFTTEELQESLSCAVLDMKDFIKKLKNMKVLKIDR